MVRLHYVGEGDRWIPGWPMSDHDEPDQALADAKIASGFYKLAPPSQQIPAEDGKPPARASERVRAAAATPEQADAADAGGDHAGS